MIKLNLRSKVNLAILTTFVIIALVFFGVQYPFQQKRLQILKDKIDILLQTLISQHLNDITTEILQNDHQALRQRIRFMLQVKGVLGICIFDVHGKLILSEGAIRNKTDLFLFDSRKAAQNVSILKRTWRNTNILNFIQEIRDKRDNSIGFILVYYSLEDEEKEHQVSMMIISGMLILIFVIMLVFLNLILSKTIINPITRLHEVTQAIAKGRLSEQIQIRSRDELGSLSMSIMEMRDAIREKIQALQTAETKYRQLFQNAVEGIFITNADGLFLDINSSLARIMGYASPIQLLESKARLTDLFGKFSIESMDMNGLFDHTDRLTNFETQITQPDGTLKDISLSLHATRDDWGNLKYIEGSVVDITERKAREKAERDREAAEAATRAKSEFLAGMSHEIRTPLNAMIGLTELFRQTRLSDKQRQYLKQIKASSDLLLGIINDILDFSKIEAGKLELEKVVFRVPEIMEDLATMFSKSADDKGLTFTIQVAPNVPEFVVGDPLRLKQVLINLVGNAIKFTDTGWVKVTVSMDWITQDTTRMKFTVSDSGIGMTKDQIRHVFSSYVQADLATARKYGGTGLGLSICKKLVELMHGQIIADSTPGRGSTFWFYGEFERASEHQIGRFLAETNPEQLKKSIPNSFSTTGLKVLLVEDNFLNQQVAVEMLETEGMQVTAVSSGRETMEILEQESFDVILMDIQMPDMDGYETTRRIRSCPEFSQIPIIAITACALDEDRQKSVEAGMNGYTTKPIDIEQLKQVLSQCIGDRAHHFNPVDETSTSPPSQSDPNPGIDLDRALKRLNGNQVLLDKLLNQFSTEYEHIPATIRNKWKNGNTEAVCHLAHMIKGIAGNLSADNLQQAAMALEMAIRQDNIGNIESLLDDFETAVNQLVAFIKQRHSLPYNNGT